MNMKEYLFLKKHFPREDALQDMILCGVDVKEALRDKIKNYKEEEITFNPLDKRDIKLKGAHNRHISHEYDKNKKQFEAFYGEKLDNDKL